MNAPEFVQLLEKTDFFSGLAQDRLTWLAEQAAEIRFDDGQLVARQGDAAGYALLRRFSGLMGTRLEAAQRKMMDQWAPAGLP